MNEVVGAGYRVQAMNKKEGLDYFLPLRVATSLRRDRVGIVHCHNFGPLVYGSIGGRLARARGIVYTAHGPEASERKKQAIFQRLRLVDRVITVSEHVRQVAIHQAGLDPRRVHTVINGIDVQKYARDSERQRMRAELGVSEDDALIGIVARLTAEKDHSMLLEAFSRVILVNPKSKLIVVGSGGLKHALMEKAQQMAVATNTVFLGSRADVPELLSALDLFVLSSHTEGLGITLLEAMAAALPVVATNVGGIPEIVLDGKTGLIVAPRDAAAFADAMIRMLSNRDAAKQMGREGRERVTQKFGVGSMVRQYEAIYSTFLSRGLRNFEN
jgi:glycosyltransferase involved in cell wall biosynthesis